MWFKISNFQVLFLILHTKQEMENIQMPKYEMPEMSEMLTSLFGGGDAAKKTTKSGGSKQGVVKRK